MGIRVAVFPIPAIGHANPLLAVVESLAHHPEVDEVRGFGANELVRPFGELGVPYVAVDNPCDESEPADERTSPLAHKSFVRPVHAVEEIMRRAVEFSPDVVFYDVFSVHGALVAQHLKVPSASFVTFPGYGALGEEFGRYHPADSPSLHAANEAYRDLFDVDLLGDGFLPVLFPSPDLSVVTAIESMAPPVSADWAVLPPGTGASVFVGPCVGTVRMTPETVDPQRVSDLPSGRTSAPGLRDRTAPFPFDHLEEAQRAGRKVVLFSLGTVLTDFRFDSPVGGAQTGRAFLRCMLHHLVDAFADALDITIVVATGSLLKDEEAPIWPEGFVVRSFVPQRELLDRYVDAFITHHGMNSTTESILAGVPMVSLPGVGDQLTNAETAVRSGSAVALWDLHDPFRTCTAEKLRQAVWTALYNPLLTQVCEDLRETLAATGGAAEAARLVVGLTKPRLP
jgi:UDP:flavonoid glycosyltransferase YjiC (YdhE family)